MQMYRKTTTHSRSPGSAAAACTSLTKRIPSPHPLHLPRPPTIMDSRPGSSIRHSFMREERPERVLGVGMALGTLDRSGESGEVR